MMKTQDISQLFSGITSKKITTQFNNNMYPIKKDSESNWLYYAFAGFKVLNDTLTKEGIVPKNFATIGSGNGVDALGASYIFKSVNEFILTDLDQKTIKLIEKNFTSNINPSRAKKVRVFSGDLCSPLIENNIKADIIYANLPNIPIWDESQTKGFGLSTFFKTQKKHRNKNLKWLENHLLELQYCFLVSSKNALQKNGSIVLVIGGRFPQKIFDKLFKVTGFKKQELCSGFKMQTEPEDVLSGYAKTEKDNSAEFCFYPFLKAKKQLERQNISILTTKKPRDLEEILSKCRVNANEALKLHRKGMAIGHTCHVFRGYL